MANIFLNQKLTVTLIAKDNNGAIIDLTTKTVHFLTSDPEGNITTDTTPTIATPTNGEVVHVYVVDDLDKAGYWIDKLLIDGDEIPSTRHRFKVHERWDR